MGERDELGEDVDRLAESMGGAREMTAAFDRELQGARRAMGGALEDLGALERGLSSGLRRALEGVALDGDRLSEALKGLGRSLADRAFTAAVEPVTDHLGGVFTRGLGAAVAGMMPQGSGSVQAFARGGVVSGATVFPTRHGAGVMGEAGPEAILPLARDASGRLGVSGGGAAPVNVTVNVRTPDVEGFRRSRSQIAAEVGRAMRHGARNS